MKKGAEQKLKTSKYLYEVFSTPDGESVVSCLRACLMGGEAGGKWPISKPGASGDIGHRLVARRGQASAQSHTLAAQSVASLAIKD